MRVRGVSRGRDVYSEVSIASSFFLSYEYKKAARRERERRKRRKDLTNLHTDEASGSAEEGSKKRKRLQETEQIEEGEESAQRVHEAPEEEEEEERQQIMVPVKELLNALMLFGDNVRVCLAWRGGGERDEGGSSRLSVGGIGPSPT